MQELLIQLCTVVREGTEEGIVPEAMALDICEEYDLHPRSCVWCQEISVDQPKCLCSHPTKVCSLYYCAQQILVWEHDTRNYRESRHQDLTYEEHQLLLFALGWTCVRECEYDVYVGVKHSIWTK